MLRVKTWLKVWEKLSFSCFHPLFLEAQVSRQYNLSWLHLETKSWSTYTSSSGNGDLLSHKAIQFQCVHSRGAVWGVREGSAGADILLSAGLWEAELCQSERVVASWKGQSLPVWNSALTELGQTLTSVFLWIMCWLPSKVRSLSWLLNNSYMKCWEVVFFFSLLCVLREALSFFDLSSNVFHCFGIILSTISCSNSFGYLVSLVTVIKFVLDYFPLVIIVFYTSDKIYTQFLNFFT